MLAQGLLVAVGDVVPSPMAWPGGPAGPADDSGFEKFDFLHQLGSSNGEGEDFLDQLTSSAGGVGDAASDENVDLLDQLSQPAGDCVPPTEGDCVPPGNGEDAWKRWLAGLAGLFNDHIATKQGDKVVFPGDRRDRGHSGTATLKSAMDMAFRGFHVGTGGGVRQDIRSHGHGTQLYCKALASQCLEDAQEAGIKEVLKRCRGCEEGKPTWLVMERKWDEAALTLRIPRCCREQVLGRLVDARTDSERTELAERLATSRVGVCHVMVQRCFLMWGPREVDSSVALLPPVLVQRTTASCLRQALDQVNPACSFESLISMAEHMQFVLIALCKDQAAANVRLAAELVLGDSVPIPRNVAILVHDCDVHCVTKIQPGLIKHHDLLGVAYCLAQLLRIHGVFDRFQAACVRFLHRMDVILLTERPKLLESRWREKAERLVSMTILREVNHTRAHLHPSAPQPAARAESQVLSDMCRRFLDGWHGEVAPTCQPCHYHDERCGMTAADCLKEMCGAFNDLMSATLPKVPAENKWSSASPLESHRANAPCSRVTRSLSLQAEC